MRDGHSFMLAPKTSKVITAFAALYVIWGSTYLGIRFAIETIPPLLMAGARFVAAGLIMYVIAWSQGIGKSTWANWRTSLIIGACLLLAGNGGVTISEQYINSGLAALIVAIVPIYIVLLGWMTGMAPKPTPIMWLALVGGFVGVGILFGPALHFSANDGLHLAAPSLRAGESRLLCVRESNRRGPIWRSFCRRNCNHAHVDCCRFDY